MQFRVRVHYVHYKGSGQVDADESAIIFVRGYYVNGVYVDNGWAELRFTPFGELWLTLPGVDEADRRGVSEFVKFYESLTRADCLEGSDFNFAPGVARSAIRGIPVSSLEFVEGGSFELQAA